MLINIKHKVTGAVMYCLDSDFNTPSNTLLEAIRSKCDLTGADLKHWDLRGIDLSGSKLREVDFSMADLAGSNLKNVDFSKSTFVGTRLCAADLRRANFTDCYMFGADKSFANLENANLTGTVLSVENFWKVSYTIDGIIRIGCKTKTLQEWDEWFAGSDYFCNARDSDEFKRIRADYLSVRAYWTALYGK